MKTSTYIQRISTLFMEIKSQYPMFGEYQSLFEDSVAVQTALYDYYAAVVDCCRHIMLVSRKQG